MKNTLIRSTLLSTLLVVSTAINAQNPMPVHEGNQISHNFDSTLSFTRTGSPTALYRIIFIHGSPGEKEAYDDYLHHSRLQEKAELIAIDRLGYGDSGKQVETSLLTQAQAITPFLSHDKQNILIGHSLGSPIALQLALIESNKIAGMVLVASAFDPELEHPKWYNHAANTLLAQWLLPRDMNNSNLEMMVLSEQLTNLSQQDWSDLTMPIRVLHGEDDDLADPDNSKFAYEKLKQNKATLRYVKGEGHLILWQNVPEVVSEIDLLLNQLP
ncbi:alpha/beta fold hydrolase [Vibrio sp. F74]|uniref:alpha/beta fold hydrolase n=1 Tax=Vibrio sp. F74 TaxID=700020 RepID=UPI0035F57025